MKSSTVSAVRASQMALVVVGAVALFIAMEQIARADPEPNGKCCVFTDACAGCRPAFDPNRWFEVPLKEWKRCYGPSDFSPPSSDCTISIPGFVNGEPVGWCYYDNTGNTPLFSDEYCTIEELPGNASHGPDFCKEPPSTACMGTP